MIVIHKLQGLCMRAVLAAISADHISRSAVLVAGSLCGALVFFVAAPLALSSPFPTPKPGDWTIHGSPIRLASLTSVPVVIEPPAALEPEANPTLWDFVTLPAYRAAALIVPKQAVDPESAGSADPESTGSIVESAPPRKRAASTMQEVDDYLWEVYQRAPVKRDSSGDFTWKDPAAAKRFGLSMPAYVITGMDPDFREQLYHAGKAMDAAGVRWAILSAFRDDYRQSIASGLKAGASNSLHGGMARTGGYGHGRAVDLTGEDGNPGPVWKWIDAHGGKYGLSRPMPGGDPAHVQAGGAWNRIALALRQSRLGAEETRAGTRTAAVKPGVAKASW
jgi:hypothetical protein